MSKLTFAKAVAYAVGGIAAVSSYGHQVFLLAQAQLEPLFGVIPSEWITPATVDSLAIIALIVRTSDTATSAMKRAALLPLILAGGLSVAANVATARNLIQVVVGVWTVLAYIVAEVFVSKLDAKATASETARPEQPASAPVSPGQPPLAVEPPEVLAFREAQRQLRATSRLTRLNPSE